jgi:hypothetical protein
LFNQGSRSSRTPDLGLIGHMTFSHVLVAAVSVAATVGSQMRRAESKPATVVLRFVDAVDVGNPVFAKLVDFDAFYRLNGDRLAGCTPAVVRKRFVALVMLPIRHARGPGSSFVRTNEYVLKESTDESHASVGLGLVG